MLLKALVPIRSALYGRITAVPNEKLKIILFIGRRL
jgi:hypothetical protein